MVYCFRIEKEVDGRSSQLCFKGHGNGRCATCDHRVPLKHDCKILGKNAVTNMYCTRICKYHNVECFYIKNEEISKVGET